MIVICPICKKKTLWEDNIFRPFCSERCKMIDLGKWAMGEYIIEGSPVDKENENREGANS